MIYYHLSSVDSTNNYLKTNYHKLRDWTILTADYQTHGRGRYDNRTWISKRGDNLLCSILIKDKKIINKHNCLVLLVGITIYRLLNKLGLKKIKIKRPNDIYVNGHKICGILLESISISDDIKALVIGIGLNLNQEVFSKELNATSYYLEAKKKIDKSKVLKLLIKTLKEELKKIKPNYQEILLKQYKKDIIE